MKIKKFRIRPRIPTVGKILKSLLSVKQLPSDVEEKLTAEAAGFSQQLIPIAFYHTWSKNDIPAAFLALLKAAGHQRAIALTALVATIGSEPEEMIAQFLMNGETQKSQIWTALCEDAADVSFQFLSRLLADEAEQDDCEISEPISVIENEHLSDILRDLEAEQEGVSLDAASHLTPRFTRVALAAWIPISKRKRVAPPLKKKSA